MLILEQEHLHCVHCGWLGSQVLMTGGRAFLTGMASLDAGGGVVLCYRQLSLSLRIICGAWCEMMSGFGEGPNAQCLLG